MELENSSRVLLLTANFASISDLLCSVQHPFFVSDMTPIPNALTVTNLAQVPLSQNLKCSKEQRTRDICGVSLPDQDTGRATLGLLTPDVVPIYLTNALRQRHRPQYMP